MKQGLLKTNNYNFPQERMDIIEGKTAGKLHGHEVLRFTPQQMRNQNKVIPGKLRGIDTRNVASLNGN